MSGRYYYDLHIHSCLSPCGDDDMTPNNIAGMGAVAKLDIMALTDHNSTLNCPAFFEAAAKYAIVPVAGMELTTAEDIHLVCLFDTLEAAMDFNSEVGRRRVPVKNRVDIFGRQLIMNGDDEIIGQEENLLPNATTLRIDEAPALVGEYNGVCYPAHIDREANGIISTLGTFPEEPFFSCAELHDPDKKNEYCLKYPILNGRRFIFSSDAHYLWLINGRLNSIELDGEAPEEIRHSLIEKLKHYERDIT